MAENDRRKSRSGPSPKAPSAPRRRATRSRQQGRGIPVSFEEQMEGTSSRKGTSIARKKPRKKAATALKKKAQSELDKLSRRTVTKTAAPKKKPTNRRHLGSPVVRSPLKKRYR